MSSAAVVSLDPSTIALPGWWRTNNLVDAGSQTWSGQASTGGSSGSRALTNALGSGPTPTGTLNGRTLANFNGAQFISSALGMTTFFPNAGFTLMILAKLRTLAAPGADAGLDAALITSVAARRFHIGVSTSGVRAELYNGDGATWADTSTVAWGALSTNTWTWINVSRTSSTNLRLQINRGSLIDKTCTNTATADTGFSTRVGVNNSGAAFIDGAIAEIICAPLLTTTEVGQIINWGNTLYGLSL
jgi:hypothetical protein